MTNYKLVLTALILTTAFGWSSQNGKLNLSDPIRSFSVVHQTDTSLNGIYIGLEYGGTSTDPVYPGKVFKLFHLGYLKIKGDSVFLDQSPIFVYKKDTTYSASDGGFYYYSGTLTKADKTVSFDLKELFCDYCGVPRQAKRNDTQQLVKRTKHLKGLLTDKGFLINGYLFKKTVKTEALISEHPGSFLK